MKKDNSHLKSLNDQLNYDIATTKTENAKIKIEKDSLKQQEQEARIYNEIQLEKAHKMAEQAISKQK